MPDNPRRSVVGQDSRLHHQPSEEHCPSQVPEETKEKCGQPVAPADLIGERPLGEDHHCGGDQLCPGKNHQDEADREDSPGDKFSSG